MGLKIEKGLKPAPRRVLLYGVQGVGKSSWAAQAPRCLFLDVEGGLGDIDCHRAAVTNFADAMDALSSLFSDDHGYRWLAIDTADWLESLIWREVCAKKHVKNLEEIPYGKGYLYAIDLWRQVLEGMDALRSEKGMGIILLAHSKIDAFRNPEGEDFDRYAPRLHKAAAQIVMEWADEVLFCTYRTYVKAAADSGFSAKGAGKGIGTGERVLRTQERPAHMAKNRLGLPEEMPLDWAEYAAYLPEGMR